MTLGWVTRWRARGLLAFLTVLLAGLLTAPGAAAAESLSVTGSPFSAVEGQALTNQQVATFFDSVGDDSAGDYTATINWGDGTSTSQGTVTGTDNTTGPWTVTGSHTYAEEGAYTVLVTVTDAKAIGSAPGVAQEFVQVSDAGLTLPAGPPTQITGAGSAAGGAMQSFEAAIGGSDNGTTTGEQNGGFRHITWDGVALNGSDPGSTTITPGHVVSVAPTRAQPWGVELSRGVGVANDGFRSVNTNLSGSEFPPFSASNVFAPFNSNRIQFQIVSPAAQASGTTSATTRGFGMMFLNVTEANTTSIQYFSGSTLLDDVAVPVGGMGQPSFVGVVFPSPAVTSVVVTMGTSAIFNFDGTTVVSGPSDTAPNNLVAGDDVVLAEPTNPQTTIQATAGVPVSAVLGSFSDTDPNGTAGDYTAVVNWGDGSQSGATLSPAGGGFSATGNHTFTRQGTFQVSTTVTDFGGSTQTSRVTVVVAPRSSSTSLACSPSRVAVQKTTTCTATVTDIGNGTSLAPTGSVLLASLAGGSFPKGQQCQLAPTSVPGRSACSISFRPTQFPPTKADLLASYDGDAAHTGSNGKRTLKVRPPTCSIALASKRIAAGIKHLPVVVKCGFLATVKVRIFAVIAARGSFPGARLRLAGLNGIVGPDKRTKLQTFVSAPALGAVVTAAKRGQRVSLELTLSGKLLSRPVNKHITVRKLHIS